MDLGPAPSGRKAGFRDINVTPLVDVMLVLLIVFMVTAPLLVSGLRVELPQVAADSAPLSDTKLILTVTPDERIMFDERDVTTNVEVVLATDARIQASKEIYIRADKEARYGVVARVVAAARVAGVTGLNLLVEPEAPEASP
ncbi:MAG: transporter [Myxococcales bacterium FL481]|nr:MAG: transporter [Myxococcales bacterium FL481]